MKRTFPDYSSTNVSKPCSSLSSSIAIVGLTDNQQLPAELSVSPTIATKKTEIDWVRQDFKCPKAEKNNCPSFLLHDDILTTLCRCPNEKCNTTFVIDRGDVDHFINNRWPKDSIFSCPLCPFSTIKYIVCRKHMTKHIIVRVTRK